MKTTIINELKKIEQEYNIEIILAVESGSRAWGFASEDSDYDVRFIYKQKTEEYLKIIPNNDVIAIPVYHDLDFHGWDIKKALFLLHKSNPSLLEWVNSPIVYMRNENFEELKELSTFYFDIKTAILHYLSYAAYNDKDSEITLKKYLYLLRGTLCSLYIEKYNKAPPVLFEELLFLVEYNNVLEQITNLVQIKKNATEKDTIRVDECLNIYIDSTINKIKTNTDELEKNIQSFDKLDVFFRKIIGVTVLK